MVEDLHKNVKDSPNSNLPAELRTFTKLFCEPVVNVGSSYRSGAHPILQVKIAAEASRSPKIGLIPVLMEEGRKLFIQRSYRACLVKFLAVEDLLRKYGEIFFQGDDSEIRAELDFLKVHFYIMADQANDACRIIKSLNDRGVSYQVHRRYSLRYQLDVYYWKNLAEALERAFIKSKIGSVFNLLGYALLMGPDPEQAKNLAKKMTYSQELHENLLQALIFSYQQQAHKSKS